jgi:DNA-binding CsgD family transcriptional regulator
MSDDILFSQIGLPQIAPILPVTIYGMTSDGVLAWISGDWSQISEQTESVLLREGLSGLVHDDDRTRVKHEKETALNEWNLGKENTRVKTFTYRLSHPQLHSIWIFEQLVHITGKRDGQPDFIGYLFDFPARQNECIAHTSLLRLSKREQELALNIASGMTNKAAARQMGISVRTVESHRARLMKKLGLKSVAELVREVMSHQAAITESPQR